LIYTINDIEEGDWVVLVYDRDTKVQVTWVSPQGQDQFQAMDWDNREIWTNLNSDDIIQIKRNPQKNQHESTHQFKSKSPQDTARVAGGKKSSLAMETSNIQGE